MRLQSQIGLLVVLAAGLAAAWFHISKQSEQAESSEPRTWSNTRPVAVHELALAENVIAFRTVGTGKAVKSAALHPVEAGEVVEVLFAPGERVKKGDKLLVMDDDHQRLAVRLAEIEVGEIRKQVARFEKLAPKGNVSAVSLDTARADLESAQLRLSQAKEALADRAVYAPFDGVIGLTDVEPGDRVDEDAMIATLDDRAQLEIQFRVPEAYALTVALGDPVTVHPWVSAEQLLPGKVTAVDSRIDPVSRSLRVKAQIENPDEAIRPGTSFDVQMTFSGGFYPSVPEVAVLWSRDGAYIWRVVDDKADKVFVDVVRRDKGQVLVKGPLAVGDPIVVEGIQGMRVGQPVEVKPPLTGFRLDWAAATARKAA